MLSSRGIPVEAIPRVRSRPTLTHRPAPVDFGNDAQSVFGTLSFNLGQLLLARLMLPGTSSSQRF